EHRDLGPGQRHDADCDGEDAAQDQGGTQRLEHDRGSFPLLAALDSRGCHCLSASMLRVSSPSTARQLSLLINYHKNDSSCQYPLGGPGASGKSPPCPAFAAAPRPSRRLAPGPFGSKIFIS